MLHFISLVQLLLVLLYFLRSSSLGRPLALLVLVRRWLTEQIKVIAAGPCMKSVMIVTMMIVDAVSADRRDYGNP